MVRVDGSNAVLMTILKTGSASTLDVIAGVKALLPKLRETLPSSLRLDAVGDQSTFVNAAVSSVIFEGVVAAALTGLMILIFLGSWRSTIIIMISIPLAILTSVALLAATGETINVMTLGGLALAVGILVDDATVTIENINYHLEQGKDIESAIMDGARQIVIPATVSLLCICIVFVPMFTLGGVAGFLFRPMAKAVVFALIGSYVLSRTLVNTMARFLLAHQARAWPRRAPRRRRAIRSPFSSADSNGASKPRGRSIGACSSPPWPGGVCSSPASWPPFSARSRSPLTSAATSFRRSKARRSRCTCAPRPELRIEETGVEVDKIEAAIRAIIPPESLRTIVDNIGLSISGINMAYSNTGTDRRLGRRHPDHPERRPGGRGAGVT